MNTEYGAIAETRKATSPGWRVGAGLEAFLGSFSAVLERTTRRYLKHRTARALSDLSDATLKDIGLNRTEIRHIRTTPIRRSRRH